MDYKLTQSSRIDSTPFTSRNALAGVSSYTIYNKTLLPTIFNSYEEDYYHLINHVQMWDVSCQKIIEIKGPDALNFLRYVSCRNFETIDKFKCYYTPMTDFNGGLLNDTLVYSIDEETIWVSISDSDMLMWFSGLLVNANHNVEIKKRDIYTIALQGPKAIKLTEELIDKKILSLSFFSFDFFNFKNTQVLVSKTGYSKQGGFEFLFDNAKIACEFWDIIIKEGKPFYIKVGCPNMIERVENALLSYGNDMTSRDTPYDCSLGKYCSIDMSYDFVGKNSLTKYINNFEKKNIFHVFFGENDLKIKSKLKCYFEQKEIGEITSIIFSPKYKKNMGFMIAYEKDISTDKSKKYFVNTEQGLIQATILNLS